MKKISSVVVLLSALLLMTACAAPVDEAGEGEAAPTAAVAAPADQAQKSGSRSDGASPAPPLPTEVPIYRIGPGDRVEVKVFKHDDLSGIFEVQADGTIRYPLIGSMKVGDLTTKEASDRLETALEQNFLVEAQLNLTVKEYLSRPVTVVGSVQRPGRYYLKAQTNLMDVITEAGGLRETAGDVVILSRKIADRRGVSTVRTWNLNVADLLRAADPATNVPLLEGDVINVPERTLFTVYGEVLKPGSFRLQRGMTLLKAISEAGGLGKFASKKGIEIHRKADQGAETVLRFNLGRIEEQDDPDPEISAGDTIVVPRRFF